MNTLRRHCPSHFPIGTAVFLLALAGCSDDSSKASTAGASTVCGTASVSGVARGTHGAAFTQSDLDKYCAWEAGCWSPTTDSSSLLKSCTVEASFLPTKQQCLAERDACVRDPASESTGGTCESAVLADVKRTCPQSVEELESCSREVLRATSQIYETASCDHAGQNVPPAPLSSACTQLFANCAIWGE